MLETVPDNWLSTTRTHIYNILNNRTKHDNKTSRMHIAVSMYPGLIVITNICANFTTYITPHESPGNLNDIPGKRQGQID